MEKIDVKQFKKDVAKLLAFQELEGEKLQTKDEAWQWVVGHKCEDEFYEKADQILAHPTFKELVDKAEKYDELLEQTRDTCPECKGGKYLGISLIDENGKPIPCPPCQGTGKTEPHPERLAVIAEGDKVICKLAWELLSPAIKKGVESEQRKIGWKIKRESEK